MKKGVCKVGVAGWSFPEGRSWACKPPYSAWMEGSLNQAEPWVDLGIEHLLLGSLNKAWEPWENKVGIRLSQDQG